MKGTVYSGIVFMPDHPSADLHGLVRVVLREINRMRVVEHLEAAGIRTVGIWTTELWRVSNSHAEQQAAEALPMGVLAACPLAKQYLSPEFYQAIPKSVLKKNRQESKREESRPRTGMVPAEKTR